MVGIKQKPNYCFVACVASKLLDDGYDKLQELILERFPKELQKDNLQTEGIPVDNFDNVQKVIMGLNLANKVEFNQMQVENAIEFLKREAHMAKWIFINTNSSGLHCVRLNEVKNEGVVVMDPTDGNFKSWNWSEFKQHYYALVIMNW